MENLENGGLGVGPTSPENPNEAAYASRLASREEDFAKRDPILERLTRAETPRDIAESLKVLASFEDFDQTEANDPYSLRYYIRAAFSGQEVFIKSNQQLVQEGIVEGEITPEGYLEDGGKIKKHGYTMRVDTPTETRRLTIPHEKRALKDDGSVEKVEKWEEVVTRDVEMEKPYFGTDAERKALARAYEATVDMFVIRERIHTLFTIYDEHKADLDGMVKLFYQRAPHLTNLMHQKIFTMPDIAMIDKEKPDNQEFGKRINLAMRLLYIVGNCETREQMERLMTTSGYRRLVQQLGEETVSRLVGNVGKWLSKSERGSEGIQSPVEAENERAKKNNVLIRGELTAYGNVFANGSPPYAVDNETMVIKVIEKIVGDPDAVRVAHRIFKLWGYADKFGVEVYGKLPSADEIIRLQEDVQAGRKTYEEWRVQADEWGKLFNIPGEPVASDMGKLFWTHYWRLKEILKDRPSGPIYTVDKVERLCLSLPELVALKTKNGHRSLDEVWWGSEDEEAKDLGEIDWLAIKTDEQIEAALEYIDAKEERAGYGAWGLFTLFLYLAGEDNPIKRPWAFLNYEDYNPQDFLKNSFFTSKVKFLRIILGHSMWGLGGNYRAARGNYRAAEKEEGEWKSIFEEYIKEMKRRGKEVKGKPPIKDVAKWDAERKIERIKREYWKGVMSLPQWKLAWEGIELKLRSRLQVSPYLTVAAEELAKRYGFR